MKRLACCLFALVCLSAGDAFANGFWRNTAPLTRDAYYLGGRGAAPHTPSPWPEHLSGYTGMGYYYPGVLTQYGFLTAHSVVRPPGYGVVGRWRRRHSRGQWYAEAALRHNLASGSPHSRHVAPLEPDAVPLPPEPRDASGQ